MFRKTLVLALVALAANLPIDRTAAEESGPFRASFELTIEAVYWFPPEYYYLVRGTGTATHLGKSEIRALMIYSPGEYFDIPDGYGSLYSANGIEYRINYANANPTADPSVFAGRAWLQAASLTGIAGNPPSFPHNLFLDIVIIDRGDGTLSLIMQGEIP